LRSSVSPRKPLHFREKYPKQRTSHVFSQLRRTQFGGRVGG
jgi:hypothetical protein